MEFLQLEGGMTAKELERLIARHGGNASALDQVTRKLREATKLSTGGRGFNAPSLPPHEAAWMLTAYAGSETASRAAHAVLFYSDFRRPDFYHVGPAGPAHGFSNGFDAAMQELLQEPRLLAEVHSIRFARNLPLVRIILRNGEVVSYCHKSEDLAEIETRAEQSFLSEGVLTRGLLEEIVANLNDGSAGAE
jgi:hypothetical protein